MGQRGQVKVSHEIIGTDLLSPMSRQGWEQWDNGDRLSVPRDFWDRFTVPNVPPAHNVPTPTVPPSNTNVQ